MGEPSVGRLEHGEHAAEERAALPDPVRRRLAESRNGVGTGQHAAGQRAVIGDGRSDERRA